MKLKYIAFYIFIFICIGLHAQIKTPELFVETSAFVSAGKNAPFWLLSNQFGKYSNHWFNINYSAGAKTIFDTAKNIDYAYGVEIMNRIDNKYTIYPHELYLAFKLWFFDIHAGWREEVFGNAYPGLTSGNMLWSGNARPMPKLSINIPEFTSVPFTWGLIKFKGNLAHGWFEKGRHVKEVLMHHKSLIGQIGGNLPVNVHYGLHHFAQWGGESPDLNYGKMPSDLEAFIWILQAKESAPGDSIGGETINRYGNHIGSRNIGLDYKTKRWKSGFYWQTIFEDTSGKNWRNIKDGLWGIYWENQQDNALIQAIVFEYLNTTDQSGPSHDPIPEQGIKGGGDDNYFNNYIYKNGWTYHNMTLGSPFITSQELNNEYLPMISNNKVKTFHFGLEGIINQKNKFKTLINYSENFGLNRRRFLPQRNSFSGIINYSFFSEKFKGQFDLNIAFDFGKMYGNNAGCFLKYQRKYNF